MIMLGGTAADVGVGADLAPRGEPGLGQGPADVGQVAGIGSAMGHVVQVASLSRRSRAAARGAGVLGISCAVAASWCGKLKRRETFARGKSSSYI